MKQFLLFSISLFIATSCAYHTGTLSSSTSSSNVIYEDVAMGVATTSNFFGIGGTNKDGLIYEAKKNLINNRPLQKNEEYLNFTIDFKRTNYLFINTVKVTVTSDVVSKTNDTFKPIYSEKYKSKVLYNVKDSTFFAVGDTIIDQKLRKGIILSILPNNKVIVLNKSKNYFEKTRKYNINSIYSTTRVKNGLKNGDYCSVVNFEGIAQTGRVIGTGVDRILILKGMDISEAIKYSKVTKRLSNN